MAEENGQESIEQKQPETDAEAPTTPEAPATPEIAEIPIDEFYVLRATDRLNIDTFAGPASEEKALPDDFEVVYPRSRWDTVRDALTPTAMLSSVLAFLLIFGAFLDRMLPGKWNPLPDDHRFIEIASEPYPEEKVIQTKVEKFIFPPTATPETSPIQTSRKETVRDAAKRLLATTDKPPVEVDVSHIPVTADGEVILTPKQLIMQLMARHNGVILGDNYHPSRIIRDVRNDLLERTARKYEILYVPEQAGIMQDAWDQFAAGNEAPLKKLTYQYGGRGYTGNSQEEREANVQKYVAAKMEGFRIARDNPNVEMVLANTAWNNVATNSSVRATEMLEIVLDQNAEVIIDNLQLMKDLIILKNTILERDNDLLAGHVKNSNVATADAILDAWDRVLDIDRGHTKLLCSIGMLHINFEERGLAYDLDRILTQNGMDVATVNIVPLHNLEGRDSFAIAGGEGTLNFTIFVEDRENGFLIGVEEAREALRNDLELINIHTAREQLYELIRRQEERARQEAADPTIDESKREKIEAARRALKAAQFIDPGFKSFKPATPEPEPTASISNVEQVLEIRGVRVVDEENSSNRGIMAGPRKTNIEFITISKAPDGSETVEETSINYITNVGSDIPRVEAVFLESRGKIFERHARVAINLDEFDIRDATEWQTRLNEALGELKQKTVDSKKQVKLFLGDVNEGTAIYSIEFENGALHIGTTSSSFETQFRQAEENLEAIPPGTQTIFIGVSSRVSNHHEKVEVNVGDLPPLTSDPDVVQQWHTRLSEGLQDLKALLDKRGKLKKGDEATPIDGIPRFFFHGVNDVAFVDGVSVSIEIFGGNETVLKVNYLHGHDSPGMPGYSSSDFWSSPQIGQQDIGLDELQSYLEHSVSDKVILVAGQDHKRSEWVEHEIDLSGIDFTSEEGRAKATQRFSVGLSELKSKLRETGHLVTIEQASEFVMSDDSYRGGINIENRPDDIVQVSFDVYDRAHNNANPVRILVGPNTSTVTIWSGDGIPPRVRKDIPVTEEMRDNGDLEAQQEAWEEAISNALDRIMGGGFLDRENEHRERNGVRER